MEGGVNFAPTPGLSVSLLETFVYEPSFNIVNKLGHQRNKAPSIRAGVTKHSWAFRDWNCGKVLWVPPAAGWQKIDCDCNQGSILTLIDFKGSEGGTLILFLSHHAPVFSFLPWGSLMLRNTNVNGISLHFLPSDNFRGHMSTQKCSWWLLAWLPFFELLAVCAWAYVWFWWETYVWFWWETCRSTSTNLKRLAAGNKAFGLQILSKVTCSPFSQWSK